MSFNSTEFLMAKRDGREHAPEDVQAFFSAYLAGHLSDYHVAAWLMAAFIRGLSTHEQVALTHAIIASGTRLDLRHIPAPKVDKHSTGGVGDKTSIVLTPLIAAMGVCVPMMSGRGLGHTGGTLDKLEAIPGMTVHLPLEHYVRILERHNGVFMAQTDAMAPLDRSLYALRDVTGTVESIPLITASIVGKKACEDLDGLVLDVKYGSGAFMRTHKDARALARSLVDTATVCGVRTSALITDMNEPLGACAGNAVEIEEALAMLRGEQVNARLADVTLRLAEDMCRAAYPDDTGTPWRAQLLACLSSGRAYEKFTAIIGAQGVPAATIKALPGCLPRAAQRVAVRARAAGVVHAIDTYRLGRLLVGLRAGRAAVADTIDPAVGVHLRTQCGAAVRAGDTLAELQVHAAVDPAPFARCFTLREEPFTPPPLILEEVR